jgi:phosphatidate cytidylyltransferase
MKKELFYRIITSIILFAALYLMFLDNSFLMIFLLIIFIFCYYEFYKLNILIKKNLKLSNIKFIYNNILFLLYLFFFTIIIYNSLINENNNKMIVLFILSVCILTDIGGIIIGKLVGGKKLTKISPNKTISGSIGGFILSFLSLLIFLSFISNYSLFNLSILVISVSFLSQIGDLIISFLKRKAKVKNTGKILPGHGGLLDRIDGILLGLPLGIIIFNILN